MSVIIHDFYYFTNNVIIEMNIFNFGVEFSSEQDCIAHFKSERERIGVKCNRD
jgi:hypothetical protein